MFLDKLLFFFIDFYALFPIICANSPLQLRARSSLILLTLTLLGFSWTGA